MWNEEQMRHRLEIDPLVSAARTQPVLPGNAPTDCEAYPRTTELLGLQEAPDECGLIARESTNRRSCGSSFGAGSPVRRR